MSGGQDIQTNHESDSGRNETSAGTLGSRQIPETQRRFPVGDFSARELLLNAPMSTTYTISELQRFEGILSRGFIQRNDAQRCSQLVSSLRTAVCNSAMFGRLDRQIQNKMHQLIVRFGNAQFAPTER